MEKLLLELKNFFINLFTDVDNALKPGIQFIAQNGGTYGLQLATQVLTSFESGASWSVIVAAFISAAEKDGISLAEGAASAVLNAAKLNLLATASGTVTAAPQPTDITPQNSTVLASDPASVDANIAATAPAAVAQVITNPDHPDYVAPQG